MSHFEDQLKAALHRKEPPADFAERVLAAATPRPAQVRRPAPKRWLPAAIAACLIAGVGGWQYQQYLSEQQGERAKEQLLVALEIASDKLNLAHEKVNHLHQRTLHD